MKIPRDLSGPDLVKALRGLGYERVRQDGSHIRLTTQRSGQHHVTVPNHSPIKLGTLTGILNAVATHHSLKVEELVQLLGLKFLDSAYAIALASRADEHFEQVGFKALLRQ